MNDWISVISAGLDPAVAMGLIAASFVASFITVSMGIGGGVLLLAVMASLLPAAALIPVHGVIQIGSNFIRAGVLARHIHWPPVAIFALGSLIGVIVGGALVVDLPSSVIQIGVGIFVIWSVLARPPKWLSDFPLITGGISSFLTMFFGATGVFVANFTKSLKLERRSHVATHAVFMSLQHALKVVVFGVLGFAFAPWIGFVIAMILGGFLGTMVGRLVLIRMGDVMFKRALNVVLMLISVQLIWAGIQALE